MLAEINIGKNEYNNEKCPTIKSKLKLNKNSNFDEFFFQALPE